LLGGAGDDVLIGGSVRDILDGGPGANTVIPGSFRPSFVASDASGASAALLGQFMASSFVPEGNGAVATVDPQANPSNMLATPQHA
jgi:Ca2+-binding RTX toxin-like protein